VALPTKASEHGRALCQFRSFMQDDTQKRTVDLKAAIVMNETQFPEFIHEKIHPGAGRSNHSSKHLL
jgi:hypothetical protein